jgi:FeS assembly SUF system protein
MSFSSDESGRKHLSVLNVAGPSSPSQFLLENEGLYSEQEQASGKSLEEAVIVALRTVSDPEIPLNIYDLGLVYRVGVDERRRVDIAMTLTSPGCPVAGSLVQQVHDAVRAVVGVTFVRTELVWEPPWTKERMGDAAKLALGLL